MTETPPRLGLIGSPGEFTLAALQTLLGHGIVPRQVLFAAAPPATPPARALPVTPPAAAGPLETLARQHRIPLHHIAHARQQPRDPVRLPAVDIALVACYPYRLPTALIHWPQRACINLHPSLLPAYRGPDPVFWQLRDDAPERGVSLHRVTDTLDAGPLLARETLHYPSGASRPALDRLLAGAGTALLIEKLGHWPDLPEARPQPAKLAGYRPAPTPADYRLHTDWRVERAFNFIRGTRTPPGGYPLRTEHGEITLDRAIAFSHGPGFERPAAGDEIELRFSDGLLRAGLREPI